MSFPLFPEFKPVGLEDKPVFDDWLARDPSPICELCFANIHIWRASERPCWTILDGSLCVLNEPEFEAPYFLPPVGGERVVDVISACLTRAPRLARVPEGFVRRFGAGFHVEEDAPNFDYLYKVEDLIELKGKRYDGKRNRIRKFESSFAHEYHALTPAEVPGCLRLLEDWFEEKSNGDPCLRGQEAAIREALGSYAALDLKGGLVKVGGRIEAFTLGGRLTADTVVIPIEIANPGLVGLAQWINREFIRREWSAYRLVNREQDMGLEGLRRAKLSYQPAGLVKKYDLTPAA